MPRRPCLSLNSRSASPIRVPLDQSGAAAAARWIASSGLRERQRPGQAGQPRGEHEGLGVRAAAGGTGQELQVGARVRLHRAGDVAEQHEPPAGEPPVSACEPDRDGRPFEGWRAACAACRCARRGGPSRSGGCAAAGLPAPDASSAGRAGRARAARERRSSCVSAAPRRWPAPAAPRARPVPRPRRGRSTVTTTGRRAVRRPSAGRRARGPRPALHRRRPRRTPRRRP